MSSHQLPLPISQPPAEAETLPPAMAAKPEILSPEAAATREPSAVAADHTAGSQRSSLPGYEVLEELGRGGMGVVYRARQVRLNRVVALKMILGGGHAGAAELARFRTEAEAIARLQHPGIVQIHEVGQHDGLPFFSLEFCPGGSLEKKLSGTPLPPRPAAALVEQLAQAVDAAHRKGVIHRDLKPANVLLAEDGTPKITDFGLARKLDEAGQTQSGAIMGTPSYMAPEQAGESSKTIGPSADVYALGAILYECLTGRPPFKAATPLDTVIQVVSQEVVPPNRLVPRLPRDLETICLKCLEKEPGRRYASAADLAEDLRRFQAGLPILARPVGAVERGWRWCLRNPWVTGLSAAFVLALIGGTAFSAYFAVLAHASAVGLVEETARANRKAEEAKEKADEAERESKRAYAGKYISDMRLLQRAWEENNLDLARDVLATTAPEQTGGSDYRGFEWHYWNRLCHIESRSLHDHAGEVVGIAFSPDSKRLACAGGNFGEPGELQVWDLARGIVTVRCQGHASVVTCVAFSLDGKFLASGDKDGMVRWWDSTSGQELTARSRRGRDSVFGLAFSPDGQQLAVAGQGVTIWDTTNGRETAVLKGHENHVLSVAFHPDGKRIASASADHTIRIWDASHGQLVRTLQGHQNRVLDVAFSPDGERLASASFDRSVKLWDASTGREIHTLLGHSEEVRGVAFNPDGTSLASVSTDRTIKVWDVSTGRELIRLQGLTSGVTSVKFSPDGARLASSSQGGSVHVWDAARGWQALLLKAGNASVAFSPDGSRLASASRDRTIRLWDAVTGQRVRTLKGHASDIHCLAYCPNGEQLASASFGQPVKIWDAASGREVRTLPNSAGRFQAVAFSRNGTRVAYASGGDPTIRLCDPVTGQEILALRGHREIVMSIAFSPDGRRLASAGGTRDKPELKVWDLSAGREILTLIGHTDLVAAVAFRPDGQSLASASQDRTIRVWNANTGEPAHTLNGHARGIYGLAFNPDGTRLASASADKDIKLWDTASWQEVLSLRGHAYGVRSLAFSPDGKRLASAGADHTVRVWEMVEPEEDFLRARQAVIRVDALAARLLLRDEVIAAVQQDRTLDEAVRRHALRIADQYREEPEALNDASWNIVVRRDGTEAQKQWALRLAEVACRISPDEGTMLNTLGVAQYRADHYREALATLTRSDRLNAKANGGSVPGDVAFLALAHWQLGEKDEARALLHRLREQMKKPRWALDSESQAFQYEAEEVIESKKLPAAKP
jgi:WD40 repeat protein